MNTLNKIIMEISHHRNYSSLNALTYGLYNGNAPDRKTVRESLAIWDGGSIDLKCSETGIGTLTLNHPKKRNAISGKMMGDLEDSLGILESWKNGKGLIICGQGGHFCSGGDLDMARGTGTADQAYATSTYMNHLIERLRNLPFITVALIEGIGALGGGAEICVACDFRVAVSGSRGIGFVHGKMGILPAWGATISRLQKIIGYRHALKMLSTASVYSPDECLQLGLIDEIVAQREDIDEWIKSMTSLSSNVICGAKLSCRLAENGENNDDTIMRLFAPFWGCEENQAALRAKIKHVT